MATSSFFYGGSSAPDQNTIDELIDALNAKVAAADEDRVAAEQANTQAQDAASNAALSEANVAGLAEQAQEALTEANEAVAAANAAVSGTATNAATATTKAAEASASAASAALSATNAASSASTAGTSATNAASSATAAAGSATSASGSATTATTKASEASASATAAATSASSASTSATNASNSASSAATSSSAASTSATNAASSASSASTSASNASSSATSASSSASTATTKASEASASASAASTSATAAAGSATAASGSASAAASSASAAATSETNAASSASAAASSATSASGSASTATTKASEASTSASNAATSASNASTSATNAANSATAASSSASDAAASAASAAAALDSFDDRYLGVKTADPTVDNDGNALVTGALYYRSTTPTGMKVYDGTQWIAASSASQVSFTATKFTATAGQTSFTVTYTPQNILVTLNGVVLDSSDFTATNGTSVVLATGAAAGDELVVYAFASFTVANAVAKTGDTMTGTLTYSPGTANGIAYLNGSKVLTSGSGLVFDGTNIGLGVTPSAWHSDSKVFQFGINGKAAFENYAGLTNNMYYNGYRDASNVSRYITTDRAARFGTSTNGGFTWEIAPSGTAGNAISFTQAMTLDASGNLGIGTASPSYRLHIQGSSGVLINAYDGSSALFRVSCASSVTTIGNQAGGGILAFDTQGTERARIDSSGRLLVGRTSAFSGTPAYIQTLATSGSTAGYNVQLTNTSTASVFECMNSSGTYIGGISCSNTATSFPTSSDYRLKDITGPVTGAEAKNFIMALQPKRGTWKVDGSPFVGFLAHEFQEVSPLSVNGEKDAVNEDGTPVYQSLESSSPEVMANLVAFIQEQQVIIEDLKTRIAALESASKGGEAA